MNITRENLNDLDIRIKIDVEANDYAEKVTKKLKDYRRRAEVPGFRKGNAPMSYIDRMYRSAVTADEVQQLLNESLYKYIEDEKLDIVGYPLSNDEMNNSVDFEHAKDFTFYFDGALMPKVDIDWSKISVKLSEVKVDKKEIDTQIDNIARQHGKFETPETVTADDFIYGKAVELDKEGNEKAEGINMFCSFELGSVKDEEIRNSFVGKKKDDKVRFAANKAFKVEDIESNFRLDPEVAKKFKSEMEFTISGNSHVTPHELNEELFNEVFPGRDIKDADAFRKAVGAEVEESYKEQCEVLFANEVRKQLLDNFNATLPQAFMKRWVLSRSNEEGLTAEKLDAEWAEKYVPAMKWEFIENALSKISDINPTHNELVDEIKGVLRRNAAFNNSEEADEKKREEELVQAANSIARDEQSTRQIADRIYHRKLVQLFRDQLKPEVEKITVKEYVARAKADNANK